VGSRVGEELAHRPHSTVVVNAAGQALEDGALWGPVGRVARSRCPSGRLVRVTPTGTSSATAPGVKNVTGGESSVPARTVAGILRGSAPDLRAALTTLGVRARVPELWGPNALAASGAPDTGRGAWAHGSQPRRDAVDDAVDRGGTWRPTSLGPGGPGWLAGSPGRPLVCDASALPTEPVPVTTPDVDLRDHLRLRSSAVGRRPRAPVVVLRACWGLVPGFVPIMYTRESRMRRAALAWVDHGGARTRRSARGRSGGRGHSGRRRMRGELSSVRSRPASWRTARRGMRESMRETHRWTWRRGWSSLPCTRRLVSPRTLNREYCAHITPPLESS